MHRPSRKKHNTCLGRRRSWSRFAYVCSRLVATMFYLHKDLSEYVSGLSEVEEIAISPERSDGSYVRSPRTRVAEQKVRYEKFSADLKQHHFIAEESLGSMSQRLALKLTKETMTASSVIRLCTPKFTEIIPLRFTRTLAGGRPI